MIPAVEIVGLTKAFPGQLALEGLDLAIAPGEVRGLVGENGSGKSTLIRCLAGFHAADRGTIAIDGVVSAPHTPSAAHAAGLRFVHQDPALFPALSVAENLAIDRRFGQSRRGAVRWRAERDAARRALDRIGADVDPRAPVSELAPAARTMVAIAAALQRPSSAGPARLLVLDEPTAALPAAEADAVLDVVRATAASGTAVLYVSHRLDEIHAVTDHVTVLRDGRRVASAATADWSRTGLVAALVGDEGEAPIRATRSRSRDDGPPRIVVEGLSVGTLHDVDFSVAPGEVVGIAGLLGSGRSRIARVVAGAQRPDRGRITLDGRPLRLGRPRDAVRVGVAYVPEDRRGDAAFSGLDLGANLTIADLAPSVRRGRLSPRRDRRQALRLIEDHDIRPPRPDRAFGLLSGGNQQKAVLARWIRRAPRVLVLDEPTQGIDINAKNEIMQLIDRLSQEGIATVFVSSDHGEYRRACDRVLVLRDGRIAGELAGAEASPARIAALATGGGTEG